MRSNFQEYVDAILNNKNSKSKNLSIIKHNSLLFPSMQDIDLESVEKLGYRIFLHRFKVNTVSEPYAPFLGIITRYVNDRLRKDDESEIDAFLDRADVYSLHRKIFKQWFKGERCTRDEEILVSEYEFEKQRMENSIIAMAKEIALEYPVIMVFSEINYAGLFIWKFVKMLIELSNSPVKLVVTYNVMADIPDYARDLSEEVLALCDDRGLATEWVYDAEGNIDNEREYPQSREEIIRRINDAVLFLECESSLENINMLKIAIQNKSMFLSKNQSFSFFMSSFWNNMLLRDFSTALYDCTRLEEFIAEGEDEQNKRLDMLYCRAIVNIYSCEIQNTSEAIAEYKENSVGEHYSGDYYYFKGELLDNMAQYYCWDNLWISENDMHVPESLIMGCKKYKYYNHLAHIWIYSFNSDYRLFETKEGVEDRIYEFNLGIETAYQIGNISLISAAYRKNVMLASIHGYFDVSIYFYEKSIKVAQNSRNELEEAAIYNGLGYSSCGIGLYEQANNYYNNALMLFYKNKKDDEVIETLYNIGINAILAEDFASAKRCLLEADYILRMFRRNYMKCCNISKLYGLIALAAYRCNVKFQTFQYLNLAKSFLGHVLYKENERESCSYDDSMFLVYFIDALFYRDNNELDKSMECMENAGFYMDRATGSHFFSVPMYRIELADLYFKIGRLKEGIDTLNAGLSFCREKKLEYYIKKYEMLILGKVYRNNNSLQTSSLVLKNIEKWIKTEALIRENKGLLRTVNLFQTLQRIISEMKGNVGQNISRLIRAFKKEFYLDSILYFRVRNQKGKIQYSDIGFEISYKIIDYIIQFFVEEKRGFCLASMAKVEEKYERIVKYFSTNGIVSFTAIPYFDNDELCGVMIAYIEMNDKWLSHKECSVIDENTFNILSYIMDMTSNAVDRLELTKSIVDANNKLTEQMNEMVDLKNMAEKANESKSRFLANMSHEIRTPINAIIGMDEMILRESHEPGVRNYAGDIRSSAKSLLTIVNDILDMTKIETGKMEIIPVEYELSTVINDVVNTLKQKIEDKGLDFILKVEEQIPSVLYGDDIRIKQVLINILSNAVKYTEKGSITFEVSGTLENDDTEDIYMKITDTGIGIKDEDLKRLFVAFERIEEERNRNIEGTGLGMNITFSMLSLMGSCLWVESEYGKGSTFSFHLKQKIIRRDPIGKIEDKMKSDMNDSMYKPVFTAPNSRILVVDDNDLNRKVFIQLLKSTRMKIDEASSGRKCLEAVQKEHYDIIFMDHMMPEMDGIETFHRLRSQPGCKCVDTPVVILTANAISGARDKYIEQGFDDYLSKPITPINLETMIKRLLSKSDIVEENVLDEGTNNDSKDKLDFTDIVEIDMNFARTFLVTDELIGSAIRDFYYDIDLQIEKINEYVSDIDNNYMPYQIITHTIKSTSKTIGALSVHGIAKICEFAAKEKNASKIISITQALVDELIVLRESLAPKFERNDNSKDKLIYSEELVKGLTQLPEYLEAFETDKVEEVIDLVEKTELPRLASGEVNALKAACRDYDEIACKKIVEELLKI